MSTSIHEGACHLVEMNGKRRTLASFMMNGPEKKTGVLRLEGRELRFYHSANRIMKRLSGLSQSVRVVRICSVNDVVDFALGEKEPEKHSNSFHINVETQNGETFRCAWKCDTVFASVGWIQALRRAKGLDQIPVVVVIGETGVGKSLLASKIGGLQAENTIFKVSAELSSETNTTNVFFTNWFGKEGVEDEVIVVDTPGLNDSEGRDDKHISDMMVKLGQIGSVNTFLLCVHAETQRLNDPLIKMLRTFENALTKRFWGHSLLVFTHWYMDAASQKRRKNKEEDMKKKWNEKLREKFDALKQLRRVDKDLVTFFVDNDPALDEEAISQRSLEEMSIAARQPYTLDCRSILPTPMVDPEPLTGVLAPQRRRGSSKSSRPGGRPTLGRQHSGINLREVPDEQRALAEMLAAMDLTDKLEVLVEQGINSPEDLMRVSDEHIQAFLGWTDEEVAKLRAWNDVSLESPNYVVVNEFRTIQISEKAIEKLKAGKFTMTEVLAMDEKDLPKKLGLSLKDMLNFSDWRETVLDEQPVTEAYVRKGSLVVRNRLQWKYDDPNNLSVSCATIHDVLGPGVVVNYLLNGRSKPEGDVAPPQGWQGNPAAFDAPVLPGWATVYWFTTGFTNTYSIGEGGLSELVFTTREKCGIEEIHQNNLTKPSFKQWENQSPRPSDVRCTFGFIKESTAHWSKFDVRPEFCQAVGQHKPGDICKVSVPISPTRAIETVAACIGAAPLTNTVVGLFYFVQGGIFGGAHAFAADPNTLRTLELVEFPYQRVPNHDDDSVRNDVIADVEKKLDETFVYLRGQDIAEPVRFDIRPEIMDAFNLGLRHGQNFEFDTGQRVIRGFAVGAHKPADEPVDIYLRIEDNAGAWLLPRYHLIKHRIKALETFERLEEHVAPTMAFRLPTEEQLNAMQFDLQFEFPVHPSSQIMRFDVSAANCFVLCGHESGTVLSNPNGRVNVVVVGGAPNPRDDKPAIWVWQEGLDGATMLPRLPSYVSSGAFRATGRKNLNEIKESIESRRQETVRWFERLLSGASANPTRSEAPPQDPDPDEARQRAASDASDDFFNQ